MKAFKLLLALGLFLLAPLATAQAQAPSLSPIPSVTLNAGGTATVNVVAVDVAGREITLSGSGLPSFVTLNTPMTGTGVVVTSLTLAPTVDHIGSYTAAVSALAGGVSDIEIFQITVNVADSNLPPVVSTPPLQEVTEGSNLNFSVSVGDPDGDPIEALFASVLPPGATFISNMSVTGGTFNWNTTLGHAGEYDVVFTAMAMNGHVGTSAAVTHIRVASAPPLTVTPIGDITVPDGTSVSFPVSASWIPGAPITLIATLPTFATLNPPGSGVGSVNTTITVSPPLGSVGTYHASLTAISGTEQDDETFDIIVTGTGGGQNRNPVLSAPASATVAIGSNLTFDVTATDPDGDHVNLVGSATPLGATFVDDGDNTGTFSWSPIAGQGGTHTASFSGTDGRGGSGSASTVITVTGDTPPNNAPVLSAPSTQQVAEGANLSFTVTATDQDGDHVALSSGPVPDGATFTDQGNNTGVFAWTPSMTQSGVYNVAFNGNDGNGGTGTASTEITVTDVVENHAPVLSAPSTQQVDEGVNLSFTVTATDQDGDHVTLSASSMPDGANFSDQGNNTGTFSWTPGSTQSGVHTAAFSGNDGNGGVGTATTTITVMDVSVPGVVPGKACLIASFKSHSGATCFRIKPVNGSFDVRDVILSSITFVFHGASVPALSDGTRIEVHCRRGGGHDDDGDDDGDGDVRRFNSRSAVAAMHLSGDHPRGEGRDEDDDDEDKRDCGGVVCGEHGGHHDDDGDDDEGDGADCDTLGIRACFSTQALLEVLDGAKMPCDLVNAEIHAMLTNGAMVVATFGKDRNRDDDGEDDGDDDGEDDGDDDGDRDDKDDDIIAEVNRGMNPKVRPNPLNPATELSFTMSREGRVRVMVYDTRGRLVKSLLDEYRSAGEQKLAWDGSNARNQRVASGVYFFRIQAPQGQVVQRVAVVK